MTNISKTEIGSSESADLSNNSPEQLGQDTRTARERILDAALELFVEQGYFNTNVPDISKRSRCSVGSIYHHFINKEEIARQLHVDGIKKFREAVSSGIDSANGLRDVIQSLVVSFLSFAESHLLWSRYLWLCRHSEFLSDKINRPSVMGFDDMGRKIALAVKQGMRSGDIPEVKAEVFWTIVFGIPLSYVRDWLEGYAKESPSSVANMIANSAWAAIQSARQ